ncbi:MAG: hypothetical protein ACKOA2_10305 [Ilumatobacteraceae bacterium]
MFAANVFHWWLGVILTVVGILASVALVAGYLKKVVSPQYPGRRSPED